MCTSFADINILIKICLKFNKTTGIKSIALYDDQEGDFSSPREKLN